MHTCIIIPAYNLAGYLAELLSKLDRYQFKIVIVDDGSTDETASCAHASGVTVLSHPVRWGKGAALQTGFAYALAGDYEWILTIDGDGQHSPDDVAHFLDAAAPIGPGIIIGNRMASAAAMPLVRRLTNRVMSVLISAMIGCTVPDSQCGFRLIHREVVRRVHLTTQHFQTESELLIKAARAGFPIISIPVQTIYHHGSSAINPVMDTLRFCGLIAKLLVL